jgi:hypothetical protein
MGDNKYHRYDDCDRRGVSRFPGPQSDSERPALTRDRYRSTQYGNCGYDDVEDDGNEGLEFDSFGTWQKLSVHLNSHLSYTDDRVLQQPFPDRQQQAGQGRMRLSFPSHRCHINLVMVKGMVAEVRCSDSWQSQVIIGSVAQHHGHLKQRVRGQLSKFNINSVTCVILTIQRSVRLQCQPNQGVQL